MTTEAISTLAKLTEKNQLTLPKFITREVGDTKYFDVKVEGGQIILTPVKIHRADAVRAKLAALELSAQDIASEQEDLLALFTFL
ncbi:MAG: hypothetical protein RLZZ381_3371 [Cyanobacteriota bacterium]